MTTSIQKRIPGPISERLQRAEQRLSRSRAFTKTQEPDTLSVALATTQADFEAAYRLIYQQYLTYGYVDENPAQLRVHLWNTLPGTYTVVAKKDGNVTGTITCILDSEAGLPMDEIARPALDALRAQGRRLCEVSGLAVDTQHSDSATVMHMFPTAVKLAANYLGATDYVITVNPKHERFYERMLRFEKIGEVAEYHKVKNAPGVPMRLNLLTMERVYFEAFGRRDGDRNLHRFFFVDRQEEMKREIEKGLAARAACLTPEFFKSLFSEKTRVLCDRDSCAAFFRQWSAHSALCSEAAVMADERGLGKPESPTLSSSQRLAQWLLNLEPQLSFL